VAFLARLAGGRDALELAVGIGRIALPLMAAGVHVDGIELSQDMITGCTRSRAGRPGDGPRRGRRGVHRALPAGADRPGPRLGIRFTRGAQSAAAQSMSAYVQLPAQVLYARTMDVAISILRAELSSWIGRAQSGEEVVVTDRGRPVARLLPVETAPLLKQLFQRGVLTKPRRADRPPARGARRVQARGPVADLVSEQRR